MILCAHAREHVHAGFCVKEEACHRTDAAQRPKQAIMKSHPSQANLRSGRLFFLAAFAFCGAAIATGFCFVYAIQVGLERLAMYHPLAEKPSISGSLHPVTTPLHIFRSLSTPWERIHVIFHVPAVNPFVSRMLLVPQVCLSGIAVGRCRNIAPHMRQTGQQSGCLPRASFIAGS